MESRDPGKQKTGRAQKLAEDTCARAYQQSLSCAYAEPLRSGSYLGYSLQHIQSVHQLAGLDKNGYDKSKCEDIFDLYRECKKREVSSRTYQQIGNVT